MKKFTVISMVLIVAIFIGLVAYIAGAEDFTPPYKIVQDMDDTKAWKGTADGLKEYLELSGVIDPAGWQELPADGTSSAVFTCDGAVIYYWSLSSMESNSSEYLSLVSVMQDGVLPVGDGTLAHVHNGAFVLEYSGYTGDAEALLTAFRNYGRVELEGTTQPDDGSDDPVWSMKLDDLAKYMEESGLVDAGARITINFGGSQKVCSGYRYEDVVDIYYYDMEQMEKHPIDNYTLEYQSIVETGTVVYSNGEVGIYYVNGPFALHYYHWNRDAISDERKAEILEYFLLFGRD